MGIVRLYLALAVLIAHAQWKFPLPVVDARQAVQIFFLISGFYMALVLSTRYASAGRFYLSRFLRIYPVYWVLLIGIVLWCTAAGLRYHRWMELAPFRYHPQTYNGGAGILIAALSNLVIFGQDGILFLQQNAGQSLRFVAHANLGKAPLAVYEIFPQGWSVGLELTFYLVAPFLQRLRDRTLILLMLVTFTTRFFIYRHFGRSFDPWTYQFFPLELGLFVMGMLGYRLYARTLARRLAPDWGNGIRYAAAVTCVLLALIAQAAATQFLCVRLGFNTGHYLTYLCWPPAMGVLFWLFGKSRADRFLGELSFPIYLVHIAVISNLLQLFDFYAIPKAYLGVLTALISVAVAIPLFLYGVKPWDRKRHALTGVRVET